MTFFKFLMFFILLHSLPLCLAQSRERTLIKIPFKKREKLLAGMRLNMNILQNLFHQLSLKEYGKMEAEIRRIQLNESILSNIAEKENIAFALLARDFHGQGVADVVKAIKTRDDREIQAKLSSFLGRCNSCHDAYRVIEWPEKDYPEPKKLPLTMPEL